jgi:hypothetical protein
MPVIRLRQLDEGTEIILALTEISNGATQAFDLTGATTTEFLFRKPNDARTVVAKAASVVSPATEGKLSYVTENGFLDEVGRWIVYAHVINPNGEWHSERGEFVVQEIIVAP